MTALQILFLGALRGARLTPGFFSFVRYFSIYFLNELLALEVFCLYACLCITCMPNAQRPDEVSGPWNWSFSCDKLPCEC